MSGDRASSTHGGGRRRQWPRALPATLAAIVSLIPFLGGLSPSHVFYVRDLGLYFWPRHLWLWTAVRNGEWPLWDPYAGAGQSAVADALNHFFLLPITPLRLVLPAVIGFNLWVAAPFPILAVGAWLWLRRHVSPAAAAVAAAVMALSGPVVSAGNFPNLSWTVALIPWVLWAAERLVAAPNTRRAAAMAGFVGVQAVAGEPVTFAGTCVLVAAYGLFALPPDANRARLQPLLWIGVALGAGVLLAAVQLVPLFYAARASLRGAEMDATFWSLHPLAAVEWIVPHLFGHVYHGNLETLPWVRALNATREPLFYSLYVGLGACVLALVRSAGRDRRWTRFWSAVLALSIIGALGEHTVVYPAAQGILPILNSFRFPIKYLIFAVVALAALAAHGVDTLFEHIRQRQVMAPPRMAVVLLAVCIAVSLVLMLGAAYEGAWIHSFWQGVANAAGVADPSAAATWIRGADALWPRSLVLAATLLFLLALVWLRHSAGTLAAWAVCGMAVADPLFVNADLHPTMEASRLGPPEWAAALSAHPNDRVYVGGRLATTSGRRQVTPELIDSPRLFDPPGELSVQEALTVYSTRFALSPAAWRIREVISYDLPQLWPRDYVAMLRTFRNASPEDRRRFLGRTGHRYCYLPAPPFPGAIALAESAIARPMALYECHDEPRRVYLAPAAAIEPARSRQLERLFDERHDPYATVLLDREPPPPVGKAGAAAPPSAIIDRERHDEVHLTANVPAEGAFLVLLDSYDPFWTAEIDGERAPLLRANGLFRAVRLAPGVHRVQFTYRPTPFYAGAGITLATGLLLVVVSVRRRQAKSSVA